MLPVFSVISIVILSKVIISIFIVSIIYKTFFPAIYNKLVVHCNYFVKGYKNIGLNYAEKSFITSVPCHQKT